MKDNQPQVRQWMLIRLLSSRRLGVTSREMASETGVTVKTIRRDLELFRTVGLPLEEQISDRGTKRWKLGKPWSESALTFTFEEAVALYLGRRFLEPLAGTPFWNAAQRAFGKIKSTLNTQALQYLERFATHFHQTTIGVRDYGPKAELIDALMVAVEDCKAAHITYQSQHATEPATRDVYPYGFIYHRGGLYLVAFAPEHDQVRHYKVDRIDAVEMSDWPFRKPEGFDLAAHLADSFGIYQGSGDLIRAQVRFAPQVARYVQESRWHSSQKLTLLDDGALLAEFDLVGTEELMSWVLSFGANAVILAPTDLVERTRVELERLLGLYNQPPPRRESGQTRSARTRSGREAAPDGSRRDHNGR